VFAVVDVETTGGHASGHRMTEIAIVITDGEKVVDRYETLLNPEQPIPLNIQILTGITPEMVADAPLFSEKAEEIRQFLGDHVFVAHNVNFDYAFVQNALQACGFTYRPRRLCTVRYARKIQAGLRSYSLKNLCKHFELVNESPHRAWGDATVTAELLNLLLSQDGKGEWEQLIKKNSGEFNLPSNLPSDEYHGLPSSPGVYYFMDQSGKPIYIGKARNLRKRVASHFITNKETRRSQAFKREIFHIDYEVTGSELLAILLEDHEIRPHWPKYNLAQKNPKKRFGIFAFQGQSGLWSLGINRITSQKGYLEEYFSYNEALNRMYELVQEFQLNPSRCGFPESYLKDSLTEEEHQANFEKMRDQLQGREDCLIIKTEGRSRDEDGFAYVENGRFAGIGFIPRDNEIRHSDDIKNYVRQLQSSITTNGLIYKILSEGKYSTIRLESVV